MNLLGYNQNDLNDLGALETANEITQQPELWIKIYNRILDQRLEISSFMSKVLDNVDSIILTGAGTSAFIGLSLKSVFSKHSNKITESISTTHLVSHPKNYLLKDRSILLVSFARSGDSPESKAAVALADKYSKECYHLIITCNPEGELANGSTKNGKFVFLLPEEANDKSLAMTSSYSGMLLSGLLIAQIKGISTLEQEVLQLARYGNNLLQQSGRLSEIANTSFTRAVFLGSGPQYGTAEEAHLKVQELSDGKVICKHDSYLGFRHGPKAVIDETTLVMYIMSNQTNVLPYEIDLVNSMHKGNKVHHEIAIVENKIDGIDLHDTLVMNGTGTSIAEEFLPVCSIIPAQILGFHKSIALGLSPDKPSASGAISRVVEGVNIYEL